MLAFAKQRKYLQDRLEASRPWFIQYILFFPENLLFAVAKYRKYLQVRLEGSRHWFICMSLVALVIGLLMSILLAQCHHTSSLEGIALGVLCSIPLLLLLWSPFLFTLSVVELTPSTELQVPLHWTIPSPSFFTQLIYLQVPLSPPRLRLA